MKNPLARVYPFIEDAVKTTGTYNPAEIVPAILEKLTAKEEVDVTNFLNYVYNNNLAFGKANFEKTYDQYAQSLNK
jgi:hypothetical protein